MVRHDSICGLPEPSYSKLATTDKKLCAITQVCRELIAMVGGGLIFETRHSHVQKRIRIWAHYMKVC